MNILLRNRLRRRMGEGLVSLVELVSLVSLVELVGLVSLVELVAIDLLKFLYP